MAAAKYFGCSIGTLLTLLLDASYISELNGIQVPKEVIDNFFKNLNDGAETNNYLFKD